MNRFCGRFIRPYPRRGHTWCPFHILIRGQSMCRRKRLSVTRVEIYFFFFFLSKIDNIMMWWGFWDSGFCCWRCCCCFWSFWYFWVSCVIQTSRWFKVSCIWCDSLFIWRQAIFFLFSYIRCCCCCWWDYKSKSYITFFMLLYGLLLCIVLLSTCFFRSVVY